MIETAQNVADRYGLTREEIDAADRRRERDRARVRGAHGRTGGRAIGRVVSSAVYGIDPLVMGLAPAWALPLAIKRAGLAPEQIDVWGVHEAFSAQALGVLRELPNQCGGFTIADDKLTPNAGAVAIGHPFGATGTRYVLTLATELRERNARYGAVGVCIGSGQAVAVVLENPEAG